MIDETTSAPAPDSSAAGGLRPWVRGVAVGLLGGLLLGVISSLSRDRLGAGDLDFWLENVGGPWMATAFAVGVLSWRRAPGAVAGVIALITALFIYDMTQLGGFSGPIQVRPFWLAVSVPFGMVFGALGGWWGERPGRNWIAPGLAAGAIAGEALALSAGGFPHARFQGSLAATQVVASLALAMLAGWQAGWWKIGILAGAIALGIAGFDLMTGFPTSLIWG